MSTRTGILEKTKEKTQHCPRWKVLFHNDDVTTMVFVVEVLKFHFGHEHARAFAIMMEVHNTGIGLAGVFSREVAELKQEQVTSLARGRGYPLVLTIEPAE